MSAVPMHVGHENSAAGAWLQPLRDWPTTIIRSLQTNAAVVRVVIASVRGSSPREVGTSMLVERERVFGTIGGGQLEWSAIATARTLLERSSCAAEVHQLLGDPESSRESSQRYGSLRHDLFHFRLRERVSDQVRFLTYRVTTPSRLEAWIAVGIGRKTLQSTPRDALR